MNKIKHRVRILVINNSKWDSYGYEIYKRKYLFRIIPYWAKIKCFENTKFNDVYKYADKIANEAYPNILELKFKNNI